MAHFPVDDATPEEIEQERTVIEPLAEVVRQLAEATVLTEVDDEEVAAAVDDLRGVLDLLLAEEG